MQQQPPSAQFGASPPSDMPPFSISTAAGPQLAEAAFPISSRPPPPVDVAAAAGGCEAVSNFDELALAAGEEGGGGTPGNRWPRQETLALLKIRSEMDAAFREATFKGPLWEAVSRKLAELGYKRSSKKCKEKFENVHKYYKRTKDGRAGRQDGKTYRFFSQLEALHNSGGGGATAPPAAAPTTISFATAMAGPSSTASIQPLPVSAVAPSAIAMPSRVVPELGPQGISTPAAAGGGSWISFSWNSSSSSESESDDEDTELEGVGSRELGRKRKRGGGGSRSGLRMMNFFEGLMKQVMERQEAMQQRFLEAIEKREQDRLIREEAWRLQEMARLGREQELLAQERAMAASRDTAVISYLQKISGQPTPLLPTAPATAAAISIIPLAPVPTQSLPPPPPQPSLKPPPKQKPAAGLQQHNALRHRSSSLAMQVVPIASEPAVEGQGSGVLEPPSSSRWPKAEVHALIQMRSGLETKYQEAGPKGPLWEEISAGMKRLGYNRSSKRCKEKWENINKYFKKVKDSSKRRPEDAKTCPYFHQLDALYRKKLHGNGGAAIGAQQQRDKDAANHSTTPPSQTQPPPAEAEGNNNGGNSDAGGGSTAAQAQTGNGFFEEGTKKSEDAVKDLMSDYDKMDDEPDSENLDQEDEDDDDDDEEDDENSKMQYKIQFQPQNVSGGGGGANASTASTATATAATTTTAGSFMAMVQ